jgi:hypothetical protein
MCARETIKQKKSIRNKRNLIFNVVTTKVFSEMVILERKLKGVKVNYVVI